MTAGPVTHIGGSLQDVALPSELYGSDGTNLAKGVTLFDSTGVAISVDNPLPTVSVAGATPYNTASNTVGYQVKNAAGVWRGFTVNTASVTGTAVIYNGTSTSGTKLATIDTTSKSSAFYDVAFATGLFIVLTGATPADVTISFY